MVFSIMVLPALIVPVATLAAAPITVVPAEMPTPTTVPASDTAPAVTETTAQPLFNSAAMRQMPETIVFVGISGNLVYYTPKSATSKISVAFGGITPPAPRAP